MQDEADAPQGKNLTLVAIDHYDDGLKEPKQVKTEVTYLLSLLPASLVLSPPSRFISRILSNDD